MSDLISRSAVIDIIHRYSCNTARIEENVLDLPTAYDISKVVAELEDMMPFCPTNSLDERTEQVLLDAIEIVKRGGVE